MLGGEIGSMFVRIRPNLTGFGTEVTSGVTAALTETQAELRTYAQESVASATKDIEANRMLSDSYAQMGAAAKKGSAEAVAASRLQAEAAVKGGLAVKAANEEAAVSTEKLKGHFLSLSSALGIGFGVDIGVHLIKDITSDAAVVQKFAEAVQANFGAAGEALTRFAEGAAISLGSSTHATEGASARFGILFKNLGIAPQLAAGMTLGFEKLALSINAIRGGGAQGAEDAINKIVTAASGNVRGLRQLGIVTDQNSIKLAAWKLGLISTVKDAITPAIRTQAIYAIATANLSKFQREAAAHGGDYANVQARLSAEWDRAKEVVGKGLLPAFTQASSGLARYIHRQLETGELQRKTNAVIHQGGEILRGIKEAVMPAVEALQEFVGILGGAKKATEIFLAVWATTKFVGIGKQIMGIGTAFKGIAAVARTTAVAVGISDAVMTTATIEAATAMKAAMISTFFGAVIVAIGVLVAYTITHWSKVKRWFAEFWMYLKIGFRDAFDIIKGFFYAWVAQDLLLLKLLADGAAHALGWLPGIGGKLKDAAKKIDGWYTEFKDKSIASFKDIGGASAHAFVTSYQHTLTASQAAMIQASGIQSEGPGAATADSPRNSARKTGEMVGRAMKEGIVSTVKDAPKTVADIASFVSQAAVKKMNEQVEASVMAAKHNLDSLGTKLADSIIKFLGKSNTAAGGPQAAAFKHLAEVLSHGGATDAILRAGQTLSSELQAKASMAHPSDLKKRQDAVKTHVANIIAQFNTGKITVAQLDKKVAATLADNHLSYAAAGKKNGYAFVQAIKAQIHDIHEQAAAINAVPARFRGAGGSGAEQRIIRPLEVLRTDQSRIALRAEKQRAKAIKAADKTNELLRRSRDLKLGKLPGGNASKNARDAARGGATP